MPFVTSFERLSREEGRLQAAREAVSDALVARFGLVPSGVNELLEAMSDGGRLREWLRAAVTADSLGAFHQAVATEPTDSSTQAPAKVSP